MYKKITSSLVLLCFCSFANAQIVNIPNWNFKNFLINQLHLDTNNDGEIQNSEAETLTSFGCTDSLISDMTGIEAFVNLTDLSVQQMPLTSLNVSTLTHLTYLSCTDTHITSLNVSPLVNLTYLNTRGCLLTSLDVSTLVNLTYLETTNNVSITDLNISSLTNLTSLRCSSNGFTSIDLSHCPNITYLDLWYVPLSILDVSNLHHLNNLLCGGGNQLTTLLMKNGMNETCQIGPSPNLSFICTDESQIGAVNFAYQGHNPSGIAAINSYCSFTPGGDYYTFQGNTKFDLNANGCDVSDVNFPNLKYSIANGANIGSFISNTSGNFSIPVLAGTNTITPVLENPSYFTISPTNVAVTFPTQTSPFIQNFCVVANGVHPDLEVSILPITVARPGFDAVYKLAYKNKGNTIQSGTVSLTFDDTVLDFVLANPTVSNQVINNLSWDFTNLVPFETREITFTLNVNSPVETPAVNGGDILNYTATITSIATDETPSDNTFAFRQTVVNSFDPNDKTCLEGTTIAPSEVGKYVHYVIRFENTGTFPAQNIVVKDIIDTTKFDVTSLVTMKGSHNFTTRIDGNKVEFIFQNINLPFDDANNDGYVAFKIKTKPTLVNGNTFSNSAGIYFDYNKPIVTNIATTTIQALSVQDFTFSSYFNLYPNPVHDVLTISTKENIEVSSINIYNTLGQLVLVIPNAKNTKIVDVSSLTSGNYFIKINSDKGTSNTKFIKN